MSGRSDTVGAMAKSVPGAHGNGQEGSVLADALAI
jgi:hypothetical protein